MTALALPLADSDRSASERAYRALVRRIATCELRAGEAVVERVEAGRLGMSRTPFRDALNRLEQEGLITRQPKRGTFVSLLDPDDIAANMAVREAIEVEMARRLIESGTAPAETLAAVLEEQRRVIAAGDHHAFLDADERFHMLLVAAAGNPRAVDVARRAWLHVNRVRYLEPMTVAAMRRARRDHVAIAAAVRDGSAEATQQAIRRHLDEPLHRLLSEHARRHPASFSPRALMALASA
ncbi:MAG: GntR family transcriptional regulator [Candidatus Dormibacteria bacterium]